MHDNPVRIFATLPLCDLNSSRHVCNSERTSLPKHDTLYSLRAYFCTDSLAAFGHNSRSNLCDSDITRIKQPLVHRQADDTSFLRRYGICTLTATTVKLVGLPALERPLLVPLSCATASHFTLLISIHTVVTTSLPSSFDSSPSIQSHLLWYHS
jgi:hypothetical protein